MFRRKKAPNVFKRFVKRIREYYLYCKVYLAEKTAAHVGNKYFAFAQANTTEGFAGKWLRFKTRMSGRKYYCQAAICRYARRSGTYKNL